MSTAELLQCDPCLGTGYAHTQDPRSGEWTRREWACHECRGTGLVDCFADGGGPGESWAQYFDGMSSSALAWANHERMLDALTAAGLLDANGITDAGKAALAASRSTEGR